MLMELKDPSKPPSARQLTPAQKEFHAAWTGEIHIVFTPEEAVRIVKGCYMMISERVEMPEGVGL